MFSVKSNEDAPKKHTRKKKKKVQDEVLIEDIVSKETVIEDIIEPEVISDQIVTTSATITDGSEKPKRKITPVQRKTISKFVLPNTSRTTSRNVRQEAINFSKNTKLSQLVSRK